MDLRTNKKIHIASLLDSYTADAKLVGGKVTAVVAKRYDTRAYVSDNAEVIIQNLAGKILTEKDLGRLLRNTGATLITTKKPIMSVAVTSEYVILLTTDALETYTNKGVLEKTVGILPGFTSYSITDNAVYLQKDVYYYTASLDRNFRDLHRSSGPPTPELKLPPGISLTAANELVRHDPATRKDVKAVFRVRFPEEIAGDMALPWGIAGVATVLAVIGFAYAFALRRQLRTR